MKFKLLAVLVVILVVVMVLYSLYEMKLRGKDNLAKVLHDE